MAATVKQLAFINSLVAERDVDEVTKATIFQICARPDASPAMGGPISLLIDELKGRPRRGVAVLPGDAARGGSLSDLLKAEVPCARYVIERNEVPLSSQLAFAGNEQVFLEVREFKGTRYMRKLIGAPGTYSRGKLVPADVREFARVISEVGALETTKRYSSRYSCCSVCGAELTDDVSVRLGLGPVCRGRFGL